MSDFRFQQRDFLGILNDMKSYYKDKMGDNWTDTSESDPAIAILEAFAYMTPVVTSNNTATAEVAGKAGVLVDPFSVNQINMGIQKILHENAVQKKARREKMKKQLERFSWQKAALATRKVYQQAIDDFNA